MSTHVLAGDGVDDIIRGRAQQLGDDGKLVHVVLSGEQGLALEHLSEDAARTPDINLDIVFLPGEHNLRSSVVSGGNIARHLWVLDSSQTEIANLQIAVLVDENIARLQITMNHAGGMDIFQAPLHAQLAEGCFEGPPGKGESRSGVRTMIW